MLFHQDIGSAHNCTLITMGELGIEVWMTKCSVIKWDFIRKQMQFLRKYIIVPLPCKELFTLPPHINETFQLFYFIQSVVTE